MKKSRYTIDVPTDDGILLFNTLNTGLVHLDESEKASYFSLIENKHEPNAEDTSLITQLSDMGYLVKDDADEYYLVERGEEQYLVTVSDEFMESRRLANRVSGKKFTVGDILFRIVQRDISKD